MSDRVETTKVTGSVAIGPSSSSVSVTKVVGYLLLIPSDSSDDNDTSRQGHVHCQIVRR